MHDELNRRIRVSESATPVGANGPIVFTTTGDKWIITPGNPIAFLRWGAIINTAKDASALVITLAVRPTAGSDTARVVQDTLTDTATARAAGVVLERRLSGVNPNQTTASDGSKVNVAALANGGIQVFPGQEAVFAVTTASAATGQGYLYADYIEYAPVPEFTALQSSAQTYTVVQL